MGFLLYFFLYNMEKSTVFFYTGKEGRMNTALQKNVDQWEITRKGTTCEEGLFKGGTNLWNSGIRKSRYC